MTPEIALTVLRKYSTSADLLNHAIAVAACLKHFAREFGHEEDFWESVGILHGLVYEMFHDKAGQTFAQIAVTENLCPTMVRSIMAHGFESLSDTAPNCQMEYVFVAADQIAQFAISTERIRDFQTVKKMLNNRDCEIGATRIIKMCKKIRKTPDQMIRQCLGAINAIADRLDFQTVDDQ